MRKIRDSKLNSLCPVGLVPDALRLELGEDVSMWMTCRKALMESECADIELDYADVQDVLVRKVRKSAKARRADRRRANRKHALRDRYHGKKEWEYIPYADHAAHVYLRGLAGDWNVRGKRLARAERDRLDVTDVQIAEARVVADFSVYGVDNFLWDAASIGELVYALAEDPTEQYYLPDDAFAIRYNDRIDFVSQYMDEDGSSWYEYRTIKRFR